MTAVPPFVMNFPHFRHQTTPKNILKRGRSSLVQIDKGLDEWKHSAAWLEDQRCKHLVKLLKAIRAWEQKKAGKTTSNVAERRAVIVELGNQVFQRLQYEDFQRRKRGGAKSNLKDLSTGYTHERTAYLNSGKSFAPSGKTVHGLMQNPQSFGIQTTKTFEQLSEQEFTRFARDFGDMSIEGYGEVHFMTKSDRVKRLLFIEDGYIWEAGGDGRPAKLETAGVGEFMYAMDEYGNLFGQNSQVALGGLTRTMGTVQTQVKGFNHSSFNAGKSVICAGTLKVVSGKLREVTNYSGHYKPSTQDVVNMLQVLKEAGIDLAMSVKVEIMGPGPAGSTVIKTYSNALTFLNNPHRVPDNTVAM